MTIVSRRGVAALAVLLFLLGCKANTIAPQRPTTSIKTLLDDPSSYDGKFVRILGDVRGSVGLLGYGAYQVNDGTGTLSVVTQGGGAPRQGARVGVEGTFRSAFTVGNQSATVLMEEQRYAP
jgi:hypothetical protein